jgi:hypothetical protein
VERFTKPSGKDSLIWLTNPDHCAQTVLIFVPLWFCVILGTHYNTFETSKSFFIMQQQMTEVQWALVSGLVSLIAIMCWATGNIYAMIFQNALLMSWHGLVALCVFFANPIGTGSGTYAVLAFAATMRAVNLSLVNGKKLGLF